MFFFYLSVTETQHKTPELELMLVETKTFSGLGLSYIE
jgi:hypothetical protein